MRGGGSAASIQDLNPSHDPIHDINFHTRKLLEVSRKKSGTHVVDARKSHQKAEKRDYVKEKVDKQN